MHSSPTTNLVNTALLLFLLLLGIISNTAVQATITVSNHGHQTVLKTGQRYTITYTLDGIASRDLTNMTGWQLDLVHANDQNTSVDLITNDFKTLRSGRTQATWTIPDDLDVSGREFFVRLSRNGSAPCDLSSKLTILKSSNSPSIRSDNHNRKKNKNSNNGPDPSTTTTIATSTTAPETAITSYPSFSPIPVPRTPPSHTLPPGFTFPTQQLFTFSIPVFEGRPAATAVPLRRSNDGSSQNVPECGEKKQ